MADTNHVHATPPVEGDGVSYRGIFWFAVVLTGTTLFCQALVWGMFVFMRSHAERNDAVRAPTAAAAAAPAIKAGHVVTGTENAPAPGLIVDEPQNLHDFRAGEERTLSSYGLDPNTGAIQIPIDRAKALVLERGLPTRPPQTAAAPAPTAPPPQSAGRPAVSGQPLPRH